MLKLPAALQAFANALKDRGATLYAVGGCVRDALLGRPVHDVDLASRLRPDELLKEAADSGIEARIVQQTLGTVVLTVDGVEYEHTTFRTESYGAGGAHKPDAVRSTRFAAIFRSTRCTNPFRTARSSIRPAG